MWERPIRVLEASNAENYLAPIEFLESLNKKVYFIGSLTSIFLIFTYLTLIQVLPLGLDFVCITKTFSPIKNIF